MAKNYNQLKVYHISVWSTADSMCTQNFMEIRCVFMHLMCFWDMCVRVFVQVMGVSVEAIFLFYTFLGAIIVIVMSVLAGRALRSTRSQVKGH